MPSKIKHKRALKKNKKNNYLIISLILGFTILLILLSLLAINKKNPPQENKIEKYKFQTTQIISSGLSQPTGFDFSPDGRIFILERAGTIKIYKNNKLLPTPFTTLPVSTEGDKGLLGLAFDPDFNSNHYAYFYFSDKDNKNKVVRIDAGNDTASKEPTIIYQTNPAQEESQNGEFRVGGSIRFGTDEALYISIGDNANTANAQNLSNPFGKIIRINKDGSIPNDNPFIGQKEKLPEIWAYGFRNPFRFQFDNTTGKMYVGDVGQDDWEEINIVEKGKNYGWPICEGTCNNPETVNPTYAYNHSENKNGASITGGTIYQGGSKGFPDEYIGNYFFADYAEGFIKRLTLDANGNSTGVSDFDLKAGTVVDLKNHPADGSLYYLTIFPEGLFQISYK